MTQERIIKYLLSSLVSLTLILTWFAACYAFGNPITVGKKLEEFTLHAPGFAAVQKYLGLEKDESFTLSQISSKLVLVEVFSTTCTACIKTSPKMNKLYKFIRQNPELDKDLKMLGVCVGASNEKVALWRKGMRVLFPLFSDKKTVAYKKFGKPGTPYMVLIERKSGKVLLAHGGAIKNVGAFFDELKKINEEL